MNVKKLFCLILFCMILTAPAISWGTGQIISDASAGYDLTKYDSSDLKKAQSGCGDNTDAYDAITNELNNRESRMNAEQEAARQAEQDVCDAVKTLQTEKQKISEIKIKYNQLLKNTPSVSDKIAALKERNKKLNAQNAIVQAAYQVVCTAADAMSSAYQKLAQSYETYGNVGDPVRIADGTYVAEYVDFEAQDYLSKFCVNRKNKSDSSVESFGKNWTCSLDSRIIRCVGEDASELIRLNHLQLESIRVCKNVLEAYNKKWGSSHPSGVIDSYLAEMIVEEAELESELSVLETHQNNRKKALNKNQFVQYGKYSDESNLWGNENFIKFIDENGEEKVFEYTGNGLWKNLSPLSDTEIKIYSVDLDGSISNALFCSRYKVVYKNGTVKYYSEYGILEKVIDRNGNEEKYSSVKGRISSIKLKTGEELTINRNNHGFITEITGPVSGSAIYKYTGNKLASVKDVSEVVVAYSYDSEGFLTEIEKSDNHSVRIGYEYVSACKKKVCTWVSDDNGNKERFEYLDKNEVHHITNMNETEIYKLNDYGNTVYFKDQRNNTASFNVNNLGLIISEKKNEVSRSFTYDADFNVVQIESENGGVETFAYNSFGLVTNHTDEDGFSESYDYDSKGNILNKRFCGNIESSIEYYPNGLISKIVEGRRIVTYQYNNYGSVVRRIEQNADFTWENKDEVWEYDNRNRVIKYVLNKDYVVTYEYRKNAFGTYDVYEVWNGKKSVLRSFDARNREISIIEKDLENEVTYTKKIEYDGKGQVLKIYADGNLFSEYEYLPDERLKSYEIWNNCGNVEYQTERHKIRTEYVYHPYGNVESIKRESETEARNYELNEYVYENNQTIVKSKQPGKYFICTYDKNGSLVKFENADGYTKNYVYSKAGRVMEIRDSEGFVWKYEYKTDGTLSVYKMDGNSEYESYFYDERGLLVRARKESQEYGYIYDSAGNLVQSVTPERITKYIFDYCGRMISETVFDLSLRKLSETEIIYDDEKSTQTIKINGNIYKVNSFDAWNRIVKEEGATGTVCYNYDFIGNCISQKNGNGVEIRFEYTPDGKMALIQYPDGSRCVNKFLPTGELIYSEKAGRQIYSANYNQSGLLESYNDEFGNVTSITYNPNYSISSISRYDTGTTFFETVNKGSTKELITKDEYGNAFTTVIDKFGNVLSEINQLGKVVAVDSDVNPELKNYKLDVNYDFDNFGCCIKKASDYFDFEYSYDSLGRLQKIRDKKSGSWLEIGYEEDSYKEDGSYREKYRKFSNGSVISYGYNSFGDKAGQVIKSAYGEIIAMEFVLYDEKGHIKSVVNKDGSFDAYEYDSSGRLVKSIRKWNDSLKIFYEKEARDCGIFSKNQDFSGSYLELSAEDKVELKKMAEKLSVSGDINFDGYQCCWVEEYVYNCNGSLISVENPVAKFIYEYDAMNRVIFKHGVNSVTGGKSLVWDDSGNLKEVKGVSGRKVFTYGANNRLVKLLEINYLSGEEKTNELAYDENGRLSSECINGSETYGYVYDEISGALIFVTPLMSNFTSSAETIGTLKTEDENVKTTNDYFENNGYKVISGDFKAYAEKAVEMETENNVDFQPIFDLRPYAVMNLGNTPVEIVYLDGSSRNGFEKEVLYQNVYGQIVRSYNEIEGLTVDSEIDLWGNEVINGKNQIIDNSARRLRSNTTIYDFGQRFYLPEINSFISMDPSRDGTNWFGYSLCDPVNYVDKGGLFKQGLTKSQEANYAAAVSEFAKYSDTSMQQNGNWQGLPIEYNCTEVSTYIDRYANEKLGIESSSKMCQQFDGYLDKNNTKAAANSVCSRYIYQDTEGKNATKTSNDLSSLSDPANVTPGTVLVWAPDNKKVNSGHTMTVLARKFDENGNIVGFTYMEGHLDIKNLTEVNYCTINEKRNDNDISKWRGHYIGTFEFSSRNSENSCSK